MAEGDKKWLPWAVSALPGVGPLIGTGVWLAQTQAKRNNERRDSAIDRAGVYGDLGNAILNPQTPQVSLPKIVLPDYAKAGDAIVGGIDSGQNRISGAFDNARGAISSGYGSAVDGVRSGYGAGRAGLTDAFNNFRTDLTGAYDSRAQGIQQFRDELGNMFNFGEDPYARALLDFTQGDITARTDAASQATRNAFDEAVASIVARGQNVDPAAAAAQVQASFDQAAQAAAAANASTAGDIAVNGQGVVGVGPATGDAADIQQYITGAGAISADAARANAQIAREAVDYLAGSTTKAGAARQGELQNMSAAAQANAVQRFMAAEQDRIAREREQFRQAEMNLRNEELMLESTLREQLANQGFDVNRALGEMSMQEGLSLADLSRAYGSDLAGLLTQQGTTLGNLDIQRGAALGDLEMRNEDARAAAENFWARELGQQAMDSAAQQQAMDITRKTIDMRLTIAAGKGKDEFLNEIEKMASDPELQPFLWTLGIADRDSGEIQYELYRSGNYNKTHRDYVPAQPSPSPHWPGYRG